MKTIIRKEFLVLTIMVLFGTILAACGTLEFGVEITPTPEPTPVPDPFVYSNEAYGFSFEYPDGWEMSESPNLVSLSQGSLKLKMVYWRQGETPPQGERMGLPAGDFIYTAKVFVEDQVIPVDALQFAGKNKMLLFNSTSPVQFGNLAMDFWLEDLESNYEEIDIPTDIQEQAISIVASIAVDESVLAAAPTLQDAQTGDAQTYTNTDYGFSLAYPVDWALSESEHEVTLSRETYDLRIGFRRLEESVDVLPYRSGLPAGDLVTMSALNSLGLELRRNVLIYDGKIKMVIYQIPGQPEVQVNDRMVMTFTLDDTQTDYLDLDIPKQIQVEVDQIISSLAITQAIQSPAGGPVIGWYGSVRSQEGDVTYNYVLDLLPPDIGTVGLLPSSESLAEQIAGIADKEPPSKYAHFWGVLDCEAPEGELCALNVERVRPDGPGDLYEADPVVGWRGIIVSTPGMAQVDDAFVIADGYPVQYGIQAHLDQADSAELDNTIRQLRDSGSMVRVWGRVTCGVMDANGCQILVERLEAE